jgi:hypothetical protein
LAVVFISPKERQKMFIIGITIVVGLFLIVVASMVLFSRPKAVSINALTFNKPKVNINFSIFNSEQFKSLKPFEDMKIQFSYKVRKDGVDDEGYISAFTEEEAKKMLEDRGYTIVQIKEADIGRENPFESYKILTEEELQAFLESQQVEAVKTGQ